MLSVGCRINITYNLIVRTVEFCFKNTSLIWDKIQLFLISEIRKAHFWWISSYLPLRPISVKLYDFRSFVSLLKSPSIRVYNTFGIYGFTEPKLTNRSTLPQLVISSRRMLIRFSKNSLITSYRGASRFNNLSFVSGYFQYTRQIKTRFNSFNGIFVNYNIGEEMNRVSNFEHCSVMLCSGDCGYYSVLNLMVQTNSCLFKSYPDVSSLQWLNCIIGSVLSAHTYTHSLSELNWLNLKRSIMFNVKYNVLNASYNPRSKFRTKHIIYVLNFVVSTNSFVLFCYGRYLKSFREKIITLLNFKVVASEINMSTLPIFSKALKCLKHYNRMLVHYN